MANEKFYLEYQSGKAAFERGEYRASIEHLSTARNLVNLSSGLGGEVQMWLVMAYEAAGQKAEAIANQTLSRVKTALGFIAVT